MPVETAPDWFQLLQLCCLDSGTFHSLGEEKAHGSKGSISSPRELHGVHATSRDSVGYVISDWGEGNGSLTLPVISLLGS